jgi:hypothetical protein
MQRQKSHNIWLAINNKPSDPTEMARLSIFHKYGGSGTKKKRSTNVYIPYEVWDLSTKDISRKAKTRTNLKAQVDEVDRMQQLIRDCIIKMNKGQLTYVSAFDIIEGKNADGDVETWLRHTKRITAPNKRGLLSRLDGIRKHVIAAGRDDLHPIKFSHLQDPQAIESIAAILRDAPSLGNGAIDYLTFLDRVTRDADLQIKDPFKRGKLIPRPEETREKMVTKMDIINGFNKISTLQDYMAVNFWLLQFCLRGLDGQDVANISEDMLVSEAKDEHHCPYLPDAKWDDMWTGHLSDKEWLKLKRGKSAKNKDFYILFNLFPTYFLHKSLQHLVSLTHPEYAYKGKDRVRIFNFTTKNKDWSENTEGTIKWNKFRDTVSKKCNKILGEGIKSVRHSFDAPANHFLRMSDTEQGELLGHKGKKGAIKHYQTEQQLKTDLLHIGVIEAMDICQIVNLFYKIGFKRGFIPFHLSLGAEQILDREKLVLFGIEDELRLQQLTKRWNENPNVNIDENGLVVMSEADKPSELKKLEKQKNRCYQASLPSLDLYAPEHQAYFTFIIPEEVESTESNISPEVKFILR